MRDDHLTGAVCHAVDRGACGIRHCNVNALLGLVNAGVVHAVATEITVDNDRDEPVAGGRLHRRRRVDER